MLALGGAIPAKRRFPVSRYRRARFRPHPAGLAADPQSPRDDGSRFTSPASRPTSCETDSLPEFEGPSDVGSSVRLQRRTLARPVRPPRAFVARFESPRGASRRFPRRILANPSHETPEQLHGGCHPAESSCESSAPETELLPSLRSRIESFLDLSVVSEPGPTQSLDCLPALQNRSMNVGYHPP